MLKRLASAAVLSVLALVLGVASAGGRALAVSTITVQVIGRGTVTSPSGMNCGNGATTCHLAFSSGGSVTFTATPAAGGWSFDSWDNCPSASGNTCTVTINGTDIPNLTANFNGPPTAISTISVTTSGFGDVTGSSITCGSHNGSPATVDSPCFETVPSGSTLTLVQEPDDGQVFTSWGGACSGTGETCTVQLSGDRAVSATWVNSTGVLLSVSVSGSGSVSGGGISCPSNCTATEAVNSTVVLTANPGDGQIFSGWSSTPINACTGTGTTCAVTMTDDTTVMATFSPVFELSVSVEGNGNVSGEGGAINCGNSASVCSANFALNKSVTLTATPVSGATFAGWSGACGSVSTTCTILMSAAKSVTATFTGGTGTGGVPLTVSVNGLGKVTGGTINCGSGSTACSTTLTSGSAITLTAVPASGASFLGWGGSCSGTLTNCTLSMTVARSVTATFSGSSGTTVPLSVSVTGPGTVTGGGISCGNGASTCKVDVAVGSSVTLLATPASGASFLRWGSSCSGTARSCTLTLSAARSVSATFSQPATPGTVTLTVKGKGSVTSSAGTCASTGAAKTCVQRFGNKKTATLTAKPATGWRFGGWSGACSGKKTSCSVSLSSGRTVGARFVQGPAGTLTRLGAAVVRHSGKRFRVTLRFKTTLSGTARMVALRAGRPLLRLPLRVAAGRVAIGPFGLKTAGLYTFRVTLASHSVHWQACLGACFAKAPSPDFSLSGQAPRSTRSGDAWSLTLQVHANLISEGQLRVLRGTKVLVRKRVIGTVGDFKIGPFLFGPGSYTVRFTATDAYGRVRTLSWLVALAP